MSEFTRPAGGVTNTSASPHCTVRSVDLDSVRWTEGLWAQRFEQTCEVTLPYLWEMLADPEQGHVLSNLRIAAGLEEGEFAGTDWQDEWMYKWLQAAAAIYQVTGDEALDARMDEVIEIIGMAQESDGYCATQTTASDQERWTDNHHHELYVMGHLLTAACRHHQVTGKTNFLDIARRVGDFVHGKFMRVEGDLVHYPLNPSIIMGCVELYRVTGERRYLDVANAFIDRRGSEPGGRGDQIQDRVPLREATRVVGHAVFYTYLFAGAADAYLETGDATLLEALDRLWHDLTSKRMYITGGTCGLHQGFSHNGDPVIEAVGPDYFLPNDTAYNETCGQIGSFMWNWRMLQITGEARFADLMEATLYNSILSGISLDGDLWNYANPLRSYGKPHDELPLRKPRNRRHLPGQPPRRADICCPSNLLRTFAELHGYLYGVSDDAFWVHQYGASRFEGQVLGGALTLTQETSYPWDGEVLLRIEEAPAEDFALMVRIPGWAEGAGLKVNGEDAAVELTPGSYARVEQSWSAGDEVTLSLPMPVRMMEGHPRIDATQNRVAFMRGPIVYCLEWPELPEGVAVPDVRAPRDIELTARHDPDLLGGVTVLEGAALRADVEDWSGQGFRPLGATEYVPLALTLIPAYAWANRGMGEMSVWLPLA